LSEGSNLDFRGNVERTNEAVGSADITVLIIAIVTLFRVLHDSVTATGYGAGIATGIFIDEVAVVATLPRVDYPVTTPLYSTV